MLRYLTSLALKYPTMYDPLPKEIKIYPRPNVKTPACEHVFVRFERTKFMRCKECGYFKR